MVYCIRPKLNRLKRARADDRAAEPPVSKRVEVEDPSAPQALPSNGSAEPSDGMNPVMILTTIPSPILAVRHLLGETPLKTHMLSVRFCNAAPGGSSDASASQASHSQADEEEEGNAAKSKHAKREQQADSGKENEYWDEEDELEEYVMRRDLGQIKDDDADGSGSGSEGAICNL